MTCGQAGHVTRECDVPPHPSTHTPCLESAAAMRSRVPNMPPASCWYTCGTVLWRYSGMVVQRYGGVAVHRLVARLRGKRGEAGMVRP